MAKPVVVDPDVRLTSALADKLGGVELDVDTCAPGHTTPHPWEISKMGTTVLRVTVGNPVATAGMKNDETDLLSPDVVTSSNCESRAGVAAICGLNWSHFVGVFAKCSPPP
jgi:hypothetical protein